MRKRILATLAALAMALTGGLVLATATPAAAAYTDCTFGQACVWANTGGTGVRVNMSYSWMSPPGTCRVINPGKIGGYKSIYSTVGSGQRVYFYNATTCTGGTFLGSVGVGQSWSSANVPGIYAVIVL